MKYLAIDTSGRNLTVAAANGKTVIYCDADCGIQHSVRVMPAVEQTLSKVDLKLSEADFFAVVVGAGSFTGIRIGVSTIKALCFANKKPCLSITSFDVLAYNKDSGKYLAVIDAKHGCYYVCGYTDGKVTYQPAFINKAELDALKKEYSFLSGEPISGVDSEVVSVSDGLVKAIEYKKDCVTDDLEKIVPLYIRKSQAEEGR